MNELRGFVLAVATAGILVAVIDALAPEGKRGRGVKFVSSLFMILMVLSPLAKLLAVRLQSCLAALTLVLCWRQRRSLRPRRQQPLHNGVFLPKWRKKQLSGQKSSSGWSAVQRQKFTR